jgi:hypothetical protein
MAAWNGFILRNLKFSMDIFTGQPVSNVETKSCHKWLREMGSEKLNDHEKKNFKKFAVKVFAF